MPGTTPAGLPYPTGTDRVTDGDNAIEALARALDPTAAAATGGVTSGTDVSAAMEVDRRGRTAFMSVDLAAGGNGNPAGQSILIVALGFRPPKARYGVVLDLNTGAPFLLEIRPDGNIVPAAGPLPALHRLVGSLEWPLPATQATQRPAEPEDPPRAEPQPKRGNTDG